MQPLESAMTRPGRLPQRQVVQVKVKPNSRLSRLDQTEDGTWLAELKAQPIDGKANDELVRLVAKQFGCRRAAVSIMSGASGRTKLVRIECVDEPEPALKHPRQR